MPSSGLVKHANAWRPSAGSPQVGLPGISMLDVPRHAAVGGWKVRSQHHGLAVAGRARDHALLLMPHGRQPFGLTSATTDCYGCHQAAWLSTQTLSGAVPNHVAALYPTTCLTCHTTWVTTGWLGATFNHTWFRIPHNGSVCSDCHLVSTDYAKFSCISCHTRANAAQQGEYGPEPSGRRRVRLWRDDLLPLS